MKDIIKMGVILMVICAVAAGALAYTNQVTSAVIENRIREQTLAQLRELFPAMADFEVKEVDGRSATLAKDAAGNVVGILAEGTTAGYGGPIRFNLGVDVDGKIVALTIIAESETAGLGNKIRESWYTDQYVGKTIGDPFDVDNITGATVSSKAMESGVEKELQEILLRFTDGSATPPPPVTPVFSLDGVADGTYTGTATGYKSDITVDVTVSGGKITEIIVTEQNETASRFELALDVIEKIIAQQTVPVDVVSGATKSSEGIMKAVLNALGQ
jgi:Na+-translocating ferredoxin:NAD+ oxidoreductase subunit G